MWHTRRRSSDAPWRPGPSGCGKTTLLDMLAGKKTLPYTGEVFLNGKPRDRLYPRVTSYVPQQDVMPPYWTVREAVEFNHRLRIEAGKETSCACVPFTHTRAHTRTHHARYTFFQPAFARLFHLLEIISSLPSPPVHHHRCVHAVPCLLSEAQS